MMNKIIVRHVTRKSSSKLLYDIEIIYSYYRFNEIGSACQISWIHLIFMHVEWRCVTAHIHISKKVNMSIKQSS